MREYSKPYYEKCVKCGAVAIRLYSTCINERMCFYCAAAYYAPYKSLGLPARNLPAARLGSLFQEFLSNEKLIPEEKFWYPMTTEEIFETDFSELYA